MTHGIPIDLRTEDEKIIIENWKDAYETPEILEEYNSEEHRENHH